MYFCKCITEVTATIVFSTDYYPSKCACVCPHSNVSYQVNLKNRFYFDLYFTKKKLGKEAVWLKEETIF